MPIIIKKAVDVFWKRAPKWKSWTFYVFSYLIILLLAAIFAGAIASEEGKTRSSAPAAIIGIYVAVATLNWFQTGTWSFRVSRFGWWMLSSGFIFYVLLRVIFSRMS